MSLFETWCTRCGWRIFNSPVNEEEKKKNDKYIYNLRKKSFLKHAVYQEFLLLTRKCLVFFDEI